MATSNDGVEVGHAVGSEPTTGFHTSYSRAGRWLRHRDEIRESRDERQSSTLYFLLLYSLRRSRWGLSATSIAKNLIHVGTPNSHKKVLLLYILAKNIPMPQAVRRRSTKYMYPFTYSQGIFQCLDGLNNARRNTCAPFTYCGGLFLGIWLETGYGRKKIEKPQLFACNGRRNSWSCLMGITSNALFRPSDRLAEGILFNVA
jgi:hypothetical protein